MSRLLLLALIRAAAFNAKAAEEIGTSRGTISAANAGVRLGNQVDGVALTAPIRSVPGNELPRVSRQGIRNGGRNRELDAQAAVSEENRLEFLLRCFAARLP